MAGGYRYRHKDGRPVPSVTTIIGHGTDQGALPPWAFKVGCEQGEAVGYLKAMCELRDQEFIVPPHLHYDLYRKGDATIGTIAHRLIEIDIYKKALVKIPGDEANRPHRLQLENSIKEYETELDSYPPSFVLSAAPCFDAFRRWEDISHIDWQHVEQALVSNTHRFGGCMDAVGIAGNKCCILDFKSSKKVWWTYWFQVAAYAMLWDENYGHAQPIDGGAHILRFGKDGTFEHHHQPDIEKEKAVFLVLLQNYRAVADYKYQKGRT